MEQFVGRCAVLLQEYGPGEAHGVELLLVDGRPLAAFQHRRIHEVPLTGGASSLRESVPLSAACTATLSGSSRRWGGRVSPWSSSRSGMAAPS